MHPLLKLVPDFVTRFGFDPTTPTISVEVSRVNGEMRTASSPGLITVEQVVPVYRDDMLAEGVCYRVVFFDNTRAPAYFVNDEPAARDDVYRCICDRGFSSLTRAIIEINQLMHPGHWARPELEEEARQMSLHHLRLLADFSHEKVTPGSRRFEHRDGMVMTNLPSADMIAVQVDPNVPPPLRRLIGGILAAALNAVHPSVESQVFQLFERQQPKRRSRSDISEA